MMMLGRPEILVIAAVGLLRFWLLPKFGVALTKQLIFGSRAGSGRLRRFSEDAQAGTTGFHSRMAWRTSPRLIRWGLPSGSRYSVAGAWPRQWKMVADRSSGRTRPSTG